MPHSTRTLMQLEQPNNFLFSVYLRWEDPSETDSQIIKFVQITMYSETEQTSESYVSHSDSETE